MNKQKARDLLREALNDPADTATIAPKKKRISTNVIYSLILAIIVTTAVSIGITSGRPDLPAGIYGKILNPAAGTITGRTISVTAETQNLEPGQYVWLAVDKPKLGLCWPKSPRLDPNTGFTTVIFEGGPKEAYTLSLYAVPKTVNDQWQDWLEAGRLGGLPMPPDKRRLDSVSLVLGE